MTPASPETSPRQVTGVRFVPGGRTFECDAGALDLRPGEVVVVADPRAGAVVATVSRATASRTVAGSLLAVLRRADERDLAKVAAEQARVATVLAFARQSGRDRGLPMKIFRVEFSPAKDRALFYFSSDERIDFRDLVRDLAGRLRCRIELRQVGVRDEAKMVGGIGSCGLELCCTTFLPRFAPVTIRAAKNQDLALSPGRVTGQCGRLKCCLVYEEAAYVEAARDLPRVGKQVETPEGVGRVDDRDILAGRIRVSFPDRPSVVFNASLLKSVPPAI